MLFRVENLGPIREAEVDLSKPLIVLAGPNNSGKTYFAWAVYGFERFDPDTALECTSAVVDQLIAASPREVSLVSLLEGGAYADELAALYSGLLYQEFAGTHAHFATAQVSLRLRPGDATVVEGKHAFAVGDREHMATLEFPTDDQAILAIRPVSSVARSPSVTAEADLDRPVFGSSALGELRSRVGTALRRALHRGLRSHYETVVFPVERLAITTFVKELGECRAALTTRSVSR